MATLPLHPCCVSYLLAHRLPYISRWMSSPRLLSYFKVAVLHQRTANKVWCLSASRAAFHFYAAECLQISISVGMSLHLQPPRLSFLSCILFIVFMNCFHSGQVNAFSRLIALLDSCRVTLLRWVKTELCCASTLCLLRTLPFVVAVMT